MPIDLASHACAQRRSAVLAAALLLGASTACLTLLADGAVGTGSQAAQLVLGETGISAEIPHHCLTREGPSTAEAVCDPDGSVEHSRRIAAAAALYFEMTVQPLPGSDTTPEGLAKVYTFADFQKDLPGAICGEDRVSRIKIESPQRLVGAGRIAYTAIVTCPEVKFLGLQPRRAIVRYILGDGRRVNVMARALADDYERTRPWIDSFLSSLTVQVEKRQ
jgi:hypothetical protein